MAGQCGIAIKKIVYDSAMFQTQAETFVLWAVGDLVRVWGLMAQYTQLLKS